jgi:hypothetical protein
VNGKDFAMTGKLFPEIRTYRDNANLSLDLEDDV